MSCPPCISPETPGASEAASGLHQGGGGFFFAEEQTFHRDALRGEVRPPKKTGQPLIAACVPRAAGAGRPLGKDSPTSWAARTPSPARWLRPSLQTQLWSSAVTAAGKTCPYLPLHPQPPPPPPCSPFTSQALRFLKALLPCRTQTSPGALMPLPCGPRVPGAPEPLQGVPATAHSTFRVQVQNPGDHEWGQEEE